MSVGSYLHLQIHLHTIAAMLQQWQTHVQITVATFTQAVETFTYAMTVTFKNSGDWNLHTVTAILKHLHTIFCKQQ